MYDVTCDILLFRTSLWYKMKKNDTVDGSNPAPPGMYKNLVNIGISTISTGAGFQPSTVCHPCSYWLYLGTVPRILYLPWLSLPAIRLKVGTAAEDPSLLHPWGPGSQWTKQIARAYPRDSSGFRLQDKDVICICSRQLLWGVRVGTLMTWRRVRRF